MPEAEKITRRKLADEVLDRLTRAIESGEYPPGSQLPSERDLMTAYGVGRPAIREALQALGQRRIIAISHGERARVVQPTPADLFLQIDHAARHLLTTSPQSLEQLKEAREFFEVGMAAEAARRARSEDIVRLEASLAAQQRCLKISPQAFVSADMAFHTTIASITRNAVFEAVSRAMLQWLSRFHAGLLHWQKHEHITLAEHRGILDAIAARDAEQAAERMRDHLRRTAGNYAAASRSAPRARASRRNSITVRHG